MFKLKLNYYTYIITLPTTLKQALLLPDPVLSGGFVDPDGPTVSYSSIYCLTLYTPKLNVEIMMILGVLEYQCQLGF